MGCWNGTNTKIRSKPFDNGATMDHYANNSSIPVLKEQSNTDGNIDVSLKLDKSHSQYVSFDMNDLTPSKSVKTEGSIYNYHLEQFLQSDEDLKLKIKNNRSKTLKSNNKEEIKRISDWKKFLIKELQLSKIKEEPDKQEQSREKRVELSPQRLALPPANILKSSPWFKGKKTILPPLKVPHKLKLDLKMVNRIEPVASSAMSTPRDELDLQPFKMNKREKEDITEARYLNDLQKIEEDDRDSLN